MGCSCSLTGPLGALPNQTHDRVRLEYEFQLCCTVSGHEKLPTGGQRSFLEMNAQRGESSGLATPSITRITGGRWHLVATRSAIVVRAQT